MWWEIHFDQLISGGFEELRGIKWIVLEQTLDYQRHLGIGCPRPKYSVKSIPSLKTWSLSMKGKLTGSTIFLGITLVFVVAGCAGQSRL